MKIIILLGILMVGCVAPAATSKLQFGRSTEQEVRAAFSRCELTKVVRPDGTSQMHVWIRATGSLTVLELDKDGVLQGVAAQVTR